MRKYLTLFVLLTTTLFSSPYVRTIDSISYKSQGGSTLVLIQLSDSSSWKWTPDAYSENLLRKWQKGDQIVIKTVNHPGFILQNLASPLYTPTVCLSYNSYNLYPYIEEIDLREDHITLSDGSKWELVYDFNKRTLVHWSVGDRIIPVVGEADNQELINLDIPFDNRCQVERSIQIIACEPPPTEWLLPLEEEENGKNVETFEEI